MSFIDWLANKWFEIIQTMIVTIGLLATLHTIKEETHSKKVQNAIALTTNHRELWAMMLQNPRLKRVLNAHVNVVRKPPTPEEELFVQMMILHLRIALKARETKLEFGDEDIRADVQEIFSLPIPKAVWEKTEHLHDDDLTKLVNASKTLGGVRTSEMS